jgi:hypothetical protein
MHMQSRRTFLQTTAGFTAASMALGYGRARGQGEPAGDCDCSAQSAVPLYAAAFLGGRYLGLAAGPSGPRVFTLALDNSRRVSLQSALKLELPAEFQPSALGVAQGRLVLAGGEPFLWDSYEVDDTLDEDLRQRLRHYPPELPTSGTRTVEVMGVRPAAFGFDPAAPATEPLALPEMPKRVFATVAAVAETDDGGLVVLVEHSGELTESWYAAAVDVLEERHGEWTVSASTAGLGESGPNYLAVSGADFVVGLNTSQGPSLLARPGSPLTSLAAPSGAVRFLGLVPGAEGFQAIAPDGNGRVRRFQLGAEAQAGRAASAPIRLAGDDIVGAVPVAGTKGQSILLGRRGAVLMDAPAAVAGALKGGSHVL